MKVQFIGPEAAATVALRAEVSATALGIAFAKENLVAPPGAAGDDAVALVDGLSALL